MKLPEAQNNEEQNLINVETQSFSGKMQIIRNMLAEKAKEGKTTRLSSYHFSYRLTTNISSHN